MSEKDDWSRLPDVTDLINETYRKGDPCEVRFFVNEFANPYVDIDAEAINALDLEGNENICEIAAGKGSFVGMLIAIGHDPDKIRAFDANIYKSYVANAIDADVLRKTIGSHITKKGLSLTKDTVEELVLILHEKPRGPEIEQGYAEDIKLSDSWADIIIGKAFMYHLNKNQRQKVYQEVKRVGKKPSADTSGCRYLFSTSYRDHKMLSRLREPEIASYLTDLTGKPTTPPPLMNAGWTTDIAWRELSDEFTYVCAQSHFGEIVPDSALARAAILAAFRTLQPLYIPSPTDEQFEQALKKKVVPRFSAPYLSADKPFDIAKRANFIASESKFKLPKGWRWVRNGDNIYSL